MEEFVGKQISVIGAARSGIAAARVLVELGASVLLSDSKPSDALDASVLNEILSLGVEFVGGASVEAALAGAELVITSPGVPKFAPVLQEAVRRGIPVWSEIELAYRITDAPIVATTGTNGKTTTTLLIAAMLTAADIPNIVCGNVSADEIKRSMVEAAFAARDMNPKPVLVAEISSFQLEWVEKFRPKVGILTNISPDHLDRYVDFDDYARTKMEILHSDWTVVNWDSIKVKYYYFEKISRGGGRITQGSGSTVGHIPFTQKTRPNDFSPYAHVRGEQDGVIEINLVGDKFVPIVSIAEFSPSLAGTHNIENVLAAASAALVMGATPDAIADAVRNFKGVPHRMEYVADVGGVRYINNSMCTNVNAAISSLKAVEGRAVVIMGGVDKGLDFAPLIPVLKEKAKHVVLIGKVAQDLEALFLEGDYYNVSRAESLQEAVGLAREKAGSGDTVLLSPACASFDMFRDFEDRGRQFRQIVKNLVESV